MVYRNGVGRPLNENAPVSLSIDVKRASMTTINGVEIELSVVIGRRTMPINHLLRMGRGAVIELESTITDEVEILANMVPIGRGEVIVEGDRITVEITKKYHLSDLAA